MAAGSRPSRFLAICLVAGLVLTLLTIWVERYETLACDTDAGVCHQLVVGYPLAYGVDHWAISPVNNVALLMLLLGEDIMRWPYFFGDWAFWTLIAFLAGLLVKRRRRA